MMGNVRRFYGVMAITLDFESNNPSSNLGRTLLFSLTFLCSTRVRDDLTLWPGKPHVV